MERASKTATVTAEKTVTVNETVSVSPIIETPPTIDQDLDIDQESLEFIEPFISVIFFPAKISRSNDPSANSDLTGSSRRDLMRCGQHFQVIGDDGLLESFFLHPGTNLGIHTLDTDDGETIDRLTEKLWRKCCENKINQSYLFYDDPFYPQTKVNTLLATPTALKKSRFEAIKVFVPQFPDDYAEPGFRNFSPEDAAELVLATMHESWIDRYMVGEKRAQILTLAERQKKEIERMRMIAANA